jgi:hypothetical protein
MIVNILIRKYSLSVHRDIVGRPEFCIICRENIQVDLEHR